MKTYSKSQILKILNSKIKRFKIPELLSFNVGQPLDSKISLDEINDKIRSKLVIIRSSAADEDGQAGSLAGEYASVQNIPSNSLEKITEATNTVIASYEKKRPLLSGDEVIIQEMLQDTTMSGVIFTHDLNTGAPYYVINYDDQSGLTYTVTSGGGEYANRTLYVHRNSIQSAS